MRNRIASGLGSAILSVVVAGAAFAAPPPSCGSCPAFGEPCTLAYGAAGAMVDRRTGAPIAGALIGVLDLAGVSAADGSFSVSGSRSETCHVDYFFSLTASAPGYQPFSFWLYTSHTFFDQTIELEPEAAAAGHTVSGTVAEFPPCEGRMRGVEVVLEPLGLTTMTSVGPTDGGTFAFTDVPPGDYTVRVALGCHHLGGCWRAPSVHLADGDVHVGVCFESVETPPPTSTPEPSAVTTPIATASPCVGDCNGDGAVGIDELIGAVQEALGGTLPAGCVSFDRDGSGAVEVNELIALVATALHGCP